MGGLCSKESNPPDNFSRPGRVLGASSSKPTANSVPVPKKIPGSSGRTVGGSDGTSDPRNAAARAAEVNVFLIIDCFLSEALVIPQFNHLLWTLLDLAASDILQILRLCKEDITS